jgi:hypothetical protein
MALTNELAEIGPARNNFRSMATVARSAIQLAGDGLVKAEHLCMAMKMQGAR